MSEIGKQATLVLGHGWGFDHQFFTPWLKHTKPDRFKVLALNQGYFEPHGLPQFLEWCPSTETWLPWAKSLEPENSPFIGIGHSLGFSKLLDLHMECGVHWHTLVSVNGFTHFLAKAGQHAGVHPLVLKRMLRKASMHVSDVISDFHAQCGAPSIWPVGGPVCSNMPRHQNPFNNRLLEDLQSMEDLNCASDLKTALEQGTRLHCITCTADRIVPAELSAACFQNPTLAAAPRPLTHHVQEGQHADFMTHPARYTWLIDQLQLAP